MATDGPTPAPCDQDIFQKGEPVALLSGSSNAVERWVQEIARKAEARVDWHYSGGIAQVLHLGDMESRRRVEKAILAMPDVENLKVLHRLPAGSPGLYRKGVSVLPEGANARFADPDSGRQIHVIGSGEE